MKKALSFLSISTLMLVMNCKKTESLSSELPKHTPVETTSSMIYKPEDLVKEAKSKPLTSLALSEKDFDFGKIKKGETVEHTYNVTNTGKNPLIISKVQPGCGCTVPDYTKDPIMPGKSGKITLKFNSSNFDGLIHKQAEVYANVETTPIIITFQGNVVDKK